ncbi:MAG: D-alanyl-D-alanine carboxypeptidase, partial [Oricola sp.]|nr:D-alanyl-D-alanine carboxypeptidase [Oricola sp.]
MITAFRSVTLLTLAVLAAFLFATTPASANSKYAAYVIHADSGDVFFDRYSSGQRYPASLTKMMTLYLLFEELEAGRMTLDGKIDVSAHSAGQPPSKLGLTSGTTIDVETAINALVVKSANDVAAAVAEEISGSEWRFAQKMTDKARELGMRSTTFRNASGLPNSKQVTTARDMAVLGRRLIQDFPQYF